MSLLSEEVNTVAGPKPNRVLSVGHDIENTAALQVFRLVADPFRAVEHCQTFSVSDACPNEPAPVYGYPANITQRFPG